MNGQHPNSLAALEANRAATQFGGERANPHHSVAGSNKPWSYRNSLRDLAGRKIGFESLEGVTEMQLVERLLPVKIAEASALQIGAARKLAKLALGSGDDHFIAEQIDGKLPQVNVNAEFGELLGMTDDELRAISQGSTVQSGADGSPPGSGRDDHPAAASEHASPAEGKTWVAPGPAVS